MNTHEFYQELKHLTELGYLEQPQLDRIRDEYLKTRRERKTMFLIFALLGVVFIGAGVISLFAYNWSMFSRELKALIAFLPLLGVQGMLYWKIRANASEVWIKSLTLALGIAFLSALGLIYQAYQISYSIQSMMLIGFLFMLPVIYLLDGYYLAVLYMAGICWAGGNSDYMLLILLLFPYYKKRIVSGETCGLLSLCFFVWLLYLPMLYMPIGSYYACILILLIYMTMERPPLYRKLSRRLLYGLLFIKAVFYLFYHDFTELFAYGTWIRQSLRLTVLLLAALLVGAVVRIGCNYKKKDKDGRLELLTSLILCVLLTADHIIIGVINCMTYQGTWSSAHNLFTHDFSAHDLFAYEILVNLCFIAFSLYRLQRGVKLADLPSVRRYTGALILYIVVKVLLGDYQLVVKGIVFIIAGLAFLAVNYRMTRKLKGGNAHEEPLQ